MAITRTKEMDLRSSDYEFLIKVATADFAKGNVHLTEEQLGFTFVDVDFSEVPEYTLITKASQVKALKAAEAIAAGDLIFWDAGNNVVTKTSAVGLYPCGYAVGSAELGDTYALINFDGRSPVAVT